jgi:hypothetical protein
MLTTQQLATMKADILANPDLNSKPNNSDGAFEIARLYNLDASPNFTVWKTNVQINDVGKKFNGTELAGLTTGNQTRLQTLAMYLAGRGQSDAAGLPAIFRRCIQRRGRGNHSGKLISVMETAGVEGRETLRHRHRHRPGTGHSHVRGRS